MKKLEDILKKEVFSVPEGYFDELPMRIQSRVASKVNAPHYQPYFISKLKYAIPLVIFLSVGILWFNNFFTHTNSESLLDTIQTEDLIAYLNDSELTTDELLEAVNFDTYDLNEIEEAVYLEDLDFNNALDD